MSSDTVTTILTQALSKLLHKTESSESVWPDSNGDRFRENIQSGIASQCNEFIKELVTLEEFIKQARSKVP